MFVLGIVLVFGVLTANNELATHDRLMDNIGMNLSSLKHFRFWTVPLATFVQASPGVAWTMLLLVGLPMIALEFMAGSWRALITFLLSDWLSAPLTVLVLWGLSGLGNTVASRVLNDPDTGSSAAAHGVIAAAIMMLPPKLAAIGMTILVGITIIAISFFRLDTSLAHFLGIAVGAVLGAIWNRQLRREPAYHAT
ncbi:MAG TPA: hypothetical protein VEQ36_08980 [Thermomicrobiales bacterium]|nr:hypothetical protein [Thermomicrobiales bacterium]